MAEKIVAKIKKLASSRIIRSQIRASWVISCPMLLIMVFEFLINLTDVYIAGRVGKEVQASYGFAVQLYFVLIVIANVVTVGTVSVVSRLFSSGRKKELAKAVFSSYAAAGCAGLVLSAIGSIFFPVIVHVLGLPAELKEFTGELIRIYALGLFFHYLLVNSNGVLRASNMIIKSLSTMAVVCAINIALNIYLVFYTPVGYKGIAISTAISVLIGCAINMARTSGLITAASKFSLRILKKIIKIGWPIGFLIIAWQMALTVIYLIIGNIHNHNVELMAALTNGLRVESAIFLSAFAFNQANAVIVGNLIGSGKRKGALMSGIVTAVIGVSLVIIMTGLVLINVRKIASLLSNDGIVIDETVRYLCITLLSEPFMAWGVILGGGLNGAGATESVMKRVVLSLWLIRIPLGYLFAVFLGFGAISLWWCMNFSILVQCFLISRKYFKRDWLRKAQPVLI